MSRRCADRRNCDLAGFAEEGQVLQLDRLRLTMNGASLLHLSSCVHSVHLCDSFRLTPLHEIVDYAGPCSIFAPEGQRFIIDTLEREL